MRARFVLIAAALAGCSADTDYVIVTVDHRPAVHDATSLQITLANGGTMRTDDLPLDGAEFPVTFSISAPERMGALDITVEARDADSVPAAE